MNVRPQFVVYLALAIVAFFSCKARADASALGASGEEIKWQKMHAAFVICVKAKGGTAQHTCAAHYADLALELYPAEGGLNSRKVASSATDKAVGDSDHANHTDSANKRTVTRPSSR